MVALHELEPPRKRIYVRRKTEWTLKEHEILMSHWPDKAKISELLPHRTERAITDFAGRCNLLRQLHGWTAAEDARLKKMVRAGIPRREICEQLGRTINQVANRMAYTKVRYGRRPPKATGHHLYDAIALRAFSLNISMRELDDECRTGSVFQKFGKGRTIAIKNIAKAAHYLQGELRIDWESPER